MRLYSDYLHVEYGDLDNDYVFVNLWGGRVGHAMSYRAVYDLVVRLRQRTGLDFDPHWFRHSAATRMLWDGASAPPSRPCRKRCATSSRRSTSPGDRQGARRGTWFHARCSVPTARRGHQAHA
ncbi:tyrosine-type recombinase/integrase [Arthrobacter ramosus]|uniref:Tyrosine-type recombinase/integrase n=1 Tax=Arthrobacter ramosus TaxID=1672 RepID=A0ABV5Y646_ARTRM|nr:tyrosine-type recombinase/integrase [Arthrobacter ramosus]